MARKPKTVPKAKVEELGEALLSRASKPKTITLEELVRSLAQPIDAMLAAGYSYQDISEVFAEQNVEIAASGLKSWHKKSQPSPSTEAVAEELPPTKESSPSANQQVSSSVVESPPVKDLSTEPSLPVKEAPAKELPVSPSEPLPPAEKASASTQKSKSSSKKSSTSELSSTEKFNTVDRSKL